ncbi:HD domain-containing protein [Brevibacillus reuszeri]|uniref:HD domain-containing protein n=1 Tax=Brevibacillus reuszeri TaxID=54915 RepID=UPI002896A709|nr:HD domain-containing protein [Brevibacillus reuszeri]
MNALEKAIVIATEAHAGQVDKGGSPYILHPLRIMLRMRTEDTMIAAVLHDVLEDTDVTVEDLKKAGISEAVIEGVVALTKQAGETYTDFIRRAKCNSIAKTVKLADLEDNCDLTRLSNPTEEDFQRVERYKRARSELLLNFSAST